MTLLETWDLRSGVNDYLGRWWTSTTTQQVGCVDYCTQLDYCLIQQITDNTVARGRSVTWPHVPLVQVQFSSELNWNCYYRNWNWIELQKRNLPRLCSAHHVTATNGLESLRPCSLSDVTVEGNLYNRRPLDVSISEYVQEIKDGIICPSIDKANCSCHRVKLSCTIYCFCSTGVVCRNSFIKKEDETGDEEQTMGMTW